MVDVSPTRRMAGIASRGRRGRSGRGCLPVDATRASKRETPARTTGSATDRAPSHDGSLLRTDATKSADTASSPSRKTTQGEAPARDRPTRRASAAEVPANSATSLVGPEVRLTRRLNCARKVGSLPRARTRMGSDGACRRSPARSRPVVACRLVTMTAARPGSLRPAGEAIGATSGRSVPLRLAVRDNQMAPCLRARTSSRSLHTTCSGLSQLTFRLILSQ